MGIFYTCKKCENKFLELEIIKSKGKVIQVCTECANGEEKYRLGFSSSRLSQSLTPVEITVDNEPYITLQDSNGHLIGKDDLLLLAKKLQEFASINELEKIIEKDNNYRFLSIFLCLKTNNSGLFVLPSDFVDVARKKFNREKRAWSFRCGNCNEKTGTNTHEYYFFVHLNKHQEMLDEFDRACSEECSNAIAKEMIKRNFSKECLKLIEPIDGFKVKVNL